MGAGITNGIIPSGGGRAHRGALVILESTEPVSLAAGQFDIPWDAIIYDTDNIWSSGAPTRLTVPAGVTRVRLGGNSRWDSSSEFRTMSIGKNGANPGGGDQDGFGRVTEAGSRAEMNIASTVLIVEAGDYFELSVTTSADTNVIASSTWFAMEIVE